MKKKTKLCGKVVHFLFAELFHVELKSYADINFVKIGWWVVSL